MRTILLCCLLLFPVVVLPSESPRPKFSDYPVTQIYEGRPAPPVLDSDHRMFRTVIREGSKSKVEFAGHYTVPRWGCGMGCTAFVIVDSITGKVYNAPATVVELPPEWVEKNLGENYKRMEFHADSRLLKLDSCPGERNCGLYDYVMVEGKGLKLIRKVLLPKEFADSPTAVPRNPQTGALQRSQAARS